jgi:hypothetical protein
MALVDQAGCILFGSVRFAGRWSSAAQSVEYAHLECFPNRISLIAIKIAHDCCKLPVETDLAEGVGMPVIIGMNSDTTQFRVL